MNLKGKKTAKKATNKSHSQGNNSNNQSKKIAPGSLPFNYFTLSNEGDERKQGDM